jgi:hypothetical protein
LADSFDYVHLGDIDLSYKPIPAAVYTLQVVKGETKEFQYKKGERAGTSGSMLKFQFAVTDHAEYSGRRLFAAFFPNDFDLRNLRRLQDATGVVQEQGEPLTEWAVRLAEIKPTFKIPVLLTNAKDFSQKGKDRLDETGNPIPENTLNWKEVSPA